MSVLHVGITARTTLALVTHAPSSTPHHFSRPGKSLAVASSPDFCLELVLDGGWTPSRDPARIWTLSWGPLCRARMNLRMRTQGLCAAPSPSLGPLGDAEMHFFLAFAVHRASGLTRCAHVSSLQKKSASESVRKANAPLMVGRLSLFCSIISLSRLSSLSLSLARFSTAGIISKSRSPNSIHHPRP
ncbi:hypothetical protein L1887_56606 [Cichorium endivia]|nr:hypothetical protein L1887_56606 [Cichorium endivia]